MLHSLSRMPAEMSSESRRKLLNAVTDLFLLDADPSEESKEHYGDIALRSLPHLDSEGRREYAGSVAETPRLPHQVAISLANDTDSEVARLVLRLSPVLTDTDLAAIAISQTQEHLAAIAERARLSEGVTDILVERGDSAVLRSVSGNEGAQFSDHGFDRLLQRGGDDTAVGEALARRSDLSPQRAERVLRIVEQMSDPGSEAGSHQAVMLARQARQQRREVRLLIADLQAGERSLDEVVTMLAEEERAFHLAQVIATRAEIATEQALRVLMQRDVSGIAVLARTLDLGKDTFHAVLLLRGRRLFKAKDPEDDLKAYEQLDMATAERTMRFLRLKTRVA
jgi:uncharacterized protein (DUF2336 family)